VILGFTAGAARGAVATGMMELLAARRTLSALCVPFATSIVLVMGVAGGAGGERRAAHPAAASVASRA
jgi:hypothetical protein